MPAMADAFHRVEVTRVRAGVRTHDRDRAATEEPLEVRLHNQPFAVIMRTPGADRELAAGFLLAEGVLKSADDLGTLEYCTDPGAEHPENIINASLMNGSANALEQLYLRRADYHNLQHMGDQDWNAGGRDFRCQTARFTMARFCDRHHQRQFQQEHQDPRQRR